MDSADCISGTDRLEVVMNFSEGQMRKGGDLNLALKCRVIARFLFS